MAAGVRPEPEPASFHATPVHDTRRFDQVHLALGWPGAAVRDPRSHALALFASAAGGGMSSRLFQQLREERGLAYSIYACSQHGDDNGLLGVYLATARGDSGRALALAREVMTATE